MESFVSLRESFIPYSTLSYSNLKLKSLLEHSNFDDWLNVTNTI